MADANPSILSHISLGTNQFDKAVAFYDRVLPTLGCKRILAHPGAVAYGRQYPEFWVQTPIDGQPASIGNGTHFGFIAPDKAAVVAEAYRVLRPGGAVAVSEFLTDPDYALASTVVTHLVLAGFGIEREVGGFAGYTVIGRKNRVAA